MEKKLYKVLSVQALIDSSNEYIFINQHFELSLVAFYFLSSLANQFKCVVLKRDVEKP